MEKIGILGAMQVEIDSILKDMEQKHEFEIAGFSFIKGVLNNKETVVGCCRVGKVNAASCTQILIDKFSVEYIINTGIAGSLKDDIGICDMVLSTDVTHHDVRKAQMKNLFPFQETFIASEKLINLAQKVCESKKIKYHCGRVISGECFVENQKLKEILIKDYAPACVEMEGSSIGHVCHINGIPFIILRSISDLANEEATMSYEQFEELAGMQSALVVKEMVALL